MKNRKSDKLAAQIAKLEAEQAEALARERAARERRIARAADRSGLADLEIPAGDLESLFKSIVAERRGDEPASESEPEPASDPAPASESAGFGGWS